MEARAPSPSVARVTFAAIWVVMFFLVGSGAARLGAAWRWLRGGDALWARTIRCLRSAFPDAQVADRAVCVRQDGLAVEVQITLSGLRLVLAGIPAEGQLRRATRDDRPHPEVTRLRVDPRYDDLIVERASDDLFSKLDPPTRVAVLHLGQAAELVDGALVVDRPWDATDDIVVLVRAMFVVGQALTSARSTRVGLLALVKDDDRGVRAQALLRLAVHPPPGWLAVLGEVASARGLSTLEALASPHADEVVAAALALGARGEVEELDDLRHALRKLGPSPQRSAVELAIGAISARLAPDGAGGLSRAEGDGDLSVAGDGGEVAVAASPGGALSVEPASPGGRSVIHDEGATLSALAASRPRAGAP